MQRAVFRTVVEATGDEPTIVISTNDLDRDGDVLDPAGCVLTNYQRNPVVLFAHDYSSLPVGTTTSVEVQPTGVRASWRWLERDDFAARVKNAFDQKVLRAASVGFRPLDSEPNGLGGLRFTRWELLEWSLVPVPANPSAVRTLKQLNLWTGDEVVLELDDDEVVLDLVDDAFGRVASRRAMTRGLDLDGGVVVDEADVAAAFRDLRGSIAVHVRDAVRAQISREISRAVDRLRGRLDG